MDHIIILTGAGISAESGMGTFRDKDGLWTKVNLKDVATPEGFARNPEMVHDFYNQQRASSRTAEANAAHHSLASLEQEHGCRVMLAYDISSIPSPVSDEIITALIAEETLASACVSNA